MPRQQGSATRWGAVPSAKSSASNIASDAQCSSPNAPVTSAVSPLAVFPSPLRECPLAMLLPPSSHACASQETQAV
jgi:hypothetical protein